MGGGFSVGGLISGLDSNSLISQIMQIERQPIQRVRDRITALERQRTALRDLRASLQTLRNRSQDFRLGVVFNKFATTSTEEKIATATVRVVEMRYFAGMTEKEIAEAQGVTERTVRRDWEKAKLLLKAALGSP